jgi:hypothetical protein
MNKMASFSFDDETNIINKAIPSAKSINKNFCGEDSDAGLWIADDNLLNINWRKNCFESCPKNCCEHFVNTKYHGIKTNNKDSNKKRIVISGRGIQNPRLIIVRKTGFLRFDNKNNFAGMWKAGDGDIKENNVKKYTCQIKYLLIFVDENNYPLHDDYVQLSTKGTFMVDFENNYKAFKKNFLLAYIKSTKKQMGQLIEQCYSYTVFVPDFQSRSVKSKFKGPNGEYLESDACYINSYVIPTEENWESLSVGRILEVNKIVTKLYEKSEDWIKRYSNEEKVNNNVALSTLYSKSSIFPQDDLLEEVREKIKYNLKIPNNDHDHDHDVE